MTDSKSTLHLLRIVFSFDNLMITLSTIVMIGLLYVIPKNLDFLDPVGQALGDVDLTDMVFSQFRSDAQSMVDTTIVLVNIGHATRGEIAYILERINQHDPAVVGMDVFFNQPKDEFDDVRLVQALQSTKNLVMVSRVAFRNDSADLNEQFDTLITSHPMFMQGARTGFANLVIDNNTFMMCREAVLRDSCAGREEPSFALMVAQVVSPEAAARARRRPIQKEVINYHGNVNAFYHIDVNQALDPEVDLSIVKNKIVLLGYMGANFGSKSLEDIFFTPMNEHYVGRSFPDMHGVVVHANTLGMILRGDYIEAMPFWASIAFGLFVLYFNVALFTYLYKRYENWYDVLAVTVQLVESVTLLFLIVFVFDRYLYKLAFTPALFGVFLVGTMHDLYQDSLKKLIMEGARRWRERRWSASSRNSDRTGAATEYQGGKNES